MKHGIGVSWKESLSAIGKRNYSPSDKRLSQPKPHDEENQQASEFQAEEPYR